MLDQLFRQEALDAYSERWLGEPSSRQGTRPIVIAVTGSAALAGLLTLLFLGMYTREVVLEAIIRGSEIEVAIKEAHARQLTAGTSVTVELKRPDGSLERFRAQIESLIPAGQRGKSPYRMNLRAPSSFHAGEALLVRIPLERRRIYQWMVSCSPS
jgi:hypothetical protein